ncbi:hypothetical protein SFOMI_1310 [Sphingobium fuliginis]|uniref:Uncharacterized protein n=1 Tax=Sphingobium fuliginis (strain ATCC 27551) TaxID=336203 RepID=A0A292ZD23_SPHSA|nr:hypothetical protein SFOMI_1310 [Sphingobium fuliginis]
MVPRAHRSRPICHVIRHAVPNSRPVERVPDRRRDPDDPLTYVIEIPASARRGNRPAIMG